MGKSEDEVHIRLKELSEVLFDGNNSALARHIEMKPSTFGKYMTGDRLPGARVLERFSQIGVNVDWLLTGEGPMYSPEMPSKTNGRSLKAPRERTDGDFADLEGEVHPIPQLQFEVEAGTGAVVYEAEESYQTQVEWLSGSYIRQEYGVSPERVRTLPVRGDSMVSTIMPGDRVRVALWDGEQMWERKIYIFKGPLGLTIKRWNTTGSNIELQADNPDVDGYRISAEEWEEQWTVVAWLLEVIKPL